MSYSKTLEEIKTWEFTKRTAYPAALEVIAEAQAKLLDMVMANGDTAIADVTEKLVKLSMQMDMAKSLLGGGCIHGNFDHVCSICMSGLLDGKESEYIFLQNAGITSIDLKNKLLIPDVEFYGESSKTWGRWIPAVFYHGKSKTPEVIIKDAFNGYIWSFKDQMAGDTPVPVSPWLVWLYCELFDTPEYISRGATLPNSRTKPSTEWMDEPVREFIVNTQDLWDIKLMQGHSGTSQQFRACSVEAMLSLKGTKKDVLPKELLGENYNSKKWAPKFGTWPMFTPRQLAPILALSKEGLSKALLLAPPTKTKDEESK